MNLKNKTRDTTIAEGVKKPEGLKEKSIGLLGKDEPEPIYIQTRWGIHTIGMDFPIDCIVADDDMVVRKLKHNLSPGNLFVWNPKYNNVFELPPGSIKESKTQVLDKLSINE